MADRKTLRQSMLEHAALWHQSGMSMRSYAKQIGVSTSKLQYWLRQYHAQHNTDDNIAETGLRFFDLSSFGSNSPEMANARQQIANASADKCSWQVNDVQPQATLTFPNGLCLKIY